MTPIEQQICSLELAKRLRELGVKQKSYFTHINHPFFGWVIYETKGVDASSYWERERYSAFTVAELGEMLPSQVHLTKESTFWDITYLENYDFFEDESMANGMAKMLIHLIENNIVKIENL